MIFKLDLIVVKLGLLVRPFASYLALCLLLDSFISAVLDTALGQFARTNVTPCFLLGRALLGETVLFGVSIQKVERHFQMWPRGVLKLVKSGGQGVS